MGPQDEPATRAPQGPEGPASSEPSVRDNGWNACYRAGSSPHRIFMVSSYLCFTWS
jgi:hypothetical protein